MTIKRANMTIFHARHLARSCRPGKTACGRSFMRTPISFTWEDFKMLAPELRCVKCAASRQAALNAASDAAKNAAAC